MTTINVYDADAEMFEVVAARTGVSEATILEAILEALEENHINIYDYI